MAFPFSEFGSRFGRPSGYGPLGPNPLDAMSPGISGLLSLFGGSFSPQQPEEGSSLGFLRDLLPGFFRPMEIGDALVGPEGPISTVSLGRNPPSGYNLLGDALFSPFGPVSSSFLGLHGGFQGGSPFRFPGSVEPKKMRISQPRSWGFGFSPMG